MARCELIAEMNLKKIIAESREVAQALNEFADNLEQIEKKYEKPQESEVEEKKETDDSIKVGDEVISEYNVKSVVFKNDDFDNLDSMLKDLWNDTESETNK